MNNKNYSKKQLFFLVALRVTIGWHFLYEGGLKLMNPNWSAKGFLLDSKGFFDWAFRLMCENDTVLSIINYLNIWGLVFIGLSLMLGLFSKYAKIGAITLLAFYYLSHPPFIGVEYMMPSEGSYLLVNKNLIELFAVAVLYCFPTGNIIGLDRLVNKIIKK